MSFCVITKKKTTALIVEFSWMDHRSKVRFNNLLFFGNYDRPTNQPTNMRGPKEVARPITHYFLRNCSVTTLLFPAKISLLEVQAGQIRKF